MTEDQLPTPAPTPDATPPADSNPPVKARGKAPDGQVRYCVYNTTLTQYVGPVTEDKPKAADAKRLVPKGHEYEIREV